MNGFRARVRAGMAAGLNLFLASGLSLLGLFLGADDAQAMSPGQMKALAGTRLLDLRVDALFRQCGLPSMIVDTAGLARHRQAIRWNGIDMKLSSLNWEMVYARQQEAAIRHKGWINPGSGSVTCLSGLAGLLLHAKGDVGALSVRKRKDGAGYLTSYEIPDSLYAAHQVIGITGNWTQGVPVSRIQGQYGKPDEVLDGVDGFQHYRYWVVTKEKEMPVSVHAVDFEVKTAEEVCARYTVRTSGFEFVQQKLDALLREWERAYVLD